MTSVTTQSPLSEAQIRIWLRGLLTIAWADGQFDDDEKAIIHTMVESEFAPNIDFDSLVPIEPQALADLDLSDADAQNFLRMAVMVALSDGTYSEPENEQIIAFAEAITPQPEAIATLKATLSKLHVGQLETPDSPADASTFAESAGAASPLHPPDHDKSTGIAPLRPVRDWLDQLTVDDPRLARFVCKLVPSQCPFERDVKVFGHKIVHIPPMCKLNPLYEQLVGLRFRALSYLADDVGEDVTPYL